MPFFLSDTAHQGLRKEPTGQGLEFVAELSTFELQHDATAAATYGSIIGSKEESNNFNELIRNAISAG